MVEALEFMLPAALACFLLTGIHGYLGRHILARGVIFVDLALAQMAALGAALGTGLAVEAGEWAVWPFSLGFTLAGAAILAVSRRLSHRLPQEALIGVLFAAAGAGTVMVLDRVPHGGEALKETLTGQILFVQWPQLGRTAALYALVGAALWRLHPALWRLSTKPQEALRSGLPVLRLDLALYALFGVVVSSSVKLGGVLLVFTLLIVPPSIARLLGVTGRHAMPFIWMVGWSLSAAGLALSYALDLPTGAAVVGLFSLALLAAAVAFGRRGSAADGA